MKDFIRKHVQDELICLSQNKSSVREMGEMIKCGEYTPTREYLALLRRVVKVQAAINSCSNDLKHVYVYRYKKGMSWVAVSFAMNVSEVTVKRYNAKLIETVAKALGWI